MTQRVFVDTSAWIAVADSSDRHHLAAMQAYTRLLKSQVTLVTTILVVAETQIWLRRRAGPRVTLTFLKNINESQRIEIVYPNARLETEAKRILRQYADQDFSLTDAISFAFMHQNGLTEALAYDQHFVTAGYTIIAD